MALLPNAFADYHLRFSMMWNCFASIESNCCVTWLGEAGNINMKIIFDKLIPLKLKSSKLAEREDGG